MSTTLQEPPVAHNGQPITKEPERTLDPALEEVDSRRSGWLTFATIALGTAGILNTIDGIVGLAKSKF